MSVKTRYRQAFRMDGPRESDFPEWHRETPKKVYNNAITAKGKKFLAAAALERKNNQQLDAYETKARANDADIEYIRKMAPKAHQELRALAVNGVIPHDVMEAWLYNEREKERQSYSTWNTTTVTINGQPAKRFDKGGASA